nr:VCBS domain-containing protein [Shewanella japonica]
MNSASGTLQAEGTQTSNVSWGAENTQGTFGQLVLNPTTGQWQYILDNSNSNTDALNEGEHQTEQFTITATDNNGDKVSAVIAIEIQGSNDLPVISGLHQASLNELGAIDSANGKLTATDPDKGDISVWGVNQTQGQFGQLTIDPSTGEWHYQLDNQSTQTFGLNAGDIATEHFQITATDSSGKPVTQIVTIEVHGTNESAQIGGINSGSVTEDKDLQSGMLRVDGAFTITDVDSGQNQFSAETLQGQFGSLTINNLGHWTYTADNAQANIQGLKTGESVTDTLLVHSVDGTEQQVTVTINGTDDKAVIAGTSTATLTEDKDVHSGLLRVDGALTITDSDNGQAQFSAETLQGQFGTLTINNLGHWTYTADNAQATIQGLKTGESVTDTLLVHSVDGTEQQVTVTINGTDDKAVITGTATASLTEDKDVHSGLLRVDGALTITDADSGQAQFNAESLKGQFGTLSINNLGHWVYTADNSQATIQGLKTGESVTDTLLVHSVDGTEQQVTVTINGTDDKAVIAGTSTATLTEDKDVHSGLLRVDGALTITDSDNGQAQFNAESIQGQFGQLSINDLGHWIYTADNSQLAVQSLNAGESLTDTLIVHSVDGTSQKVTVTINGSEDKAVIAGTSTATLTEDKDVHSGLLRVDGALTVTDVDSGQNQFQAASLQGQFGTLSINDLGHWTYTADNSQPNIQGLKTGESLTDTLLVHSVDGTEQQVTVTINGSEDKAVIAGTATATLTEDKDVHSGLLRVDGALTVTDVDSGQNQFQAASLQGQFGTLSINDLGHWIYTADNSQLAVQSLNAGESLTDTLIVHSVDGTSQKVTVTINGTDDKAVITGFTTASLTEDKDVHSGLLRVDGALTVTDVDSGQNQFQAASLQGQFGTLSINDLGHWFYTANNSQLAVQSINAGESLTDTLIVHSIDGTAQKITVTINGTDDKAVIAGTSTASMTEDKDAHSGLLRVDGALTITDSDNGQAQFSAETLQGQFGSLTINNLGHWTYTADNAQANIQGLKTGESVTDTLLVHSVDGTEQQVTVTINGTDDKAVIAGTATASLTEDKDVHSGLLRVDGALTITDSDNGQAQFSAETLQGQFGSLTINNLGHWTYTADNAQANIQGLKTGESVTDTLLVHAVDGTEQQVTVTINGTDDKAVIAGTATASLTEDKDVHSGLLRVDGALTITDSDNGQAQFSAETLQGQFGTLTINNLGHWTYTADNAQANIQGLKTGESLTDTLLVHSVDGTEQQVTVTINGTDDKAVIAGTSTATLTEDKDVHSGLLRVDGALTITDSDNGQAQFSAETLQGQFGTLTINNLGHWTYTADNSQANIQGLKTGESVTDTLLVHSVDGTEQQVTVTINGTDDKAVIAGTSTATLTEDKDVHSGLLRVDGALTITDSDNGQAQFSAETLQGQFGTLSINNLGHWVYTADNSQATIQGLKTGESVTDTLLVHSVDGTEQQVTVTINGTDDKAVIAGTSTATLTEDKDVHSGLLRVDGALTITDSDNGQAQFSAETLQGQFGTLSINNLGHWVYTADNSQATIQGLKTGESVTDTLLVHSVDGTEQQVTVTINGTNDLPVISGASSGSVVELGENLIGTANISGKLTATDIDSTDSIKWAISQPQGHFGSLSIDQHGNWSYQLDNSSAGAADKLATGQQQQETFWVTATDSSGVDVPHQITVDITGSNDRPIVTAWTQLASGTEDKSVIIKAADLLTHATDVDTTDTLQIDHLQANHGLLTNNHDGSYTFTPDKDYNGEVRLTYNVVDGQAGSVSTQAKFNLAASPDNAIITDAQTDLNVRGVTEDRGYIDTHYQLHYNGQLNIQDPDVGEALFDPNIGPQTYQGIGYDTKLGGHVLLMQDGRYTYTLDNRHIQNLAEGEVKQDSVVIRSGDGTSHTIELTVHGTNDKPTIAAQSHSVIEGGAQLNGQMLGHDVDTGAILHYSTPAVDGLIFNSDGSYSFNPSNSNYQSLASGITKTITIPVTVTDEHNASSTQNLTISITGINNAAIIGGVDTGDVIESTAGRDMSPDYAQPGMSHLGNSPLYASGALNINDLDTDESAFDSRGIGYNYAGKYGDLLLREDGNWSYYADAGNIRGKGGYATNRGSAIDQLGKGESITDTVTVYSKDGTSHDIVITIHGSNDRPYCSSEVILNAGSEDTRQTITVAQLLQNTVDVDNNDVGLLTIENLHADHGSIKHNKDGSFSFSPEKDYNGQVHFTYDVKDGHGGVTHTSASTSLSAVNDNPDVSPLADSIKEGASHNLDLLTGATDIEGDTLHIEQLTYSIDGAPSTTQLPSGLSLAADGHTLMIDATDPAYNHLANGQSLKIAVSYLVNDGHGGQSQQTANLTIQGTDDKATLVSNVIQLTENQALDSQFKTYKGNLQLVDPDTGDKTHFAQLSGTYLGQGFAPGNLDVWSDGSYQFRLEGASNRHADDLISSLHTGESLEIPYEVKTSDGQTLTIMVKVIGEDNQARIEVGRYSSFNEHAYEDNLSPGSTPNQIYSGGNLHVIDPDHDQAGFIAQNLTTPEGGHFFINARGNWAYTIDNDKLQHLGAGQSYQKTFTVESIDGSAHQNITVTVHGTNDAPVVSAQVQLAAGTEDTDIQLSTAELIANATDVDDNDAGQLSIANLTADHGTITVNPNGTFTFHPQKDYNGQVHFSYDVKDAHGGVTHTGATTSLAAVQDSAVITEVNTGSIIEDGPHGSNTNGTVNEIATGTLNVTDPDSGENAFRYSQFGETKIHDPFGGMLRIDNGGSWGYSVNNANLQHLAEGQTEVVIYRVHSKDGTPYDLHINVTGTNDAPTVNQVHLTNGTEDVSYQMQASQFGFTDVDNKDALHSVSVTDLPDPLQGKFMLDGQAISANQVIAAGDISKLQFVPTHNFNGDVNFSYTVNDGHADSAKASNTLHISPVNDAATIDGQTQSSTSASITEDSATSVISGQLTLVDPDAGEDKFATNTQISGQYGQLTVDQDGSWHYALNNASPLVNMLSAGQQLTDTITVTSPDGTASQTIAITIHGHSDTPSLQLQEAGTVQGLDLFAGIQGNGIIQLQYSTDGVTFSSQVPAGFSLAADGHTLEVDPANAAYDHLANGAQHKIWVNYQLQEGAGSSAHQSSQQAEVVIVGTSDKPIIHGFNANSAQFSGPVTGNLLQGATDVDDGAQLVLQDLQFKDPTTHQYVTVHVGKGEDIKGVGHISIASNGDYTFTPDPNFSGDVPGFIYRVVDTHGDYQDNSQNMLDIHINANHQPRVQTFTASTAEDTDFQFTAASFGYQDSDSDVFDHLSINQLPDPATGSLWLNGHAVTQGQAISANDIDTLIFKPAANFNGDAHFSYVASDGHQDSAAHTAVLTVTAVNDLPVLTINQTSHTQGNLVATDVDKGDVLSFSAPLVTGQFGSLSIDPDSGAYIYTQNNSVAQMNYNPATSTYSGVDVFEVQVSDHHGGVASKFISFSAEATVSSTTAGTLIISSSVPNQPLVSNTIPTGYIGVTPPANHVSIDLSSTSDSGSSNHDDLTNDTTPTITGHTDIPFSKVTIYDGNTPVGHALSNASGDFNATLSSLAEGLHNLSAKALAPSSILPAVSSVLDIEIDTQASATIQLDPITSDNVINAQESGADISVTGQVNGDVHQGDSVSLIVGQHSYSATVDASGHFNVNIAGTELASSSSITASVITTDSAGNSASASQVMHYSSDTQVGMPTITFENPGSDNAYSKAEIAQGDAGTITATVHAAADAQIGEHLSINGVDHVLDANSLAHGIDLEVAPSSIVRAIMTDEHGNVNSALNIAASAKPEPIVVTAPPGSHQIGASLGVPTLIPTQTPVPTAQQGWKILVNGHYQTSYTSQWGTLTINPKTGQLNYQEHANTHTGPHGSAQNVGVHEDRFEVALQGSHHDDVIMHVQVSILSRGPGHSGKLTLGSEVLDMTVTPTFSHPAPPPPPLAADAHDIPQSDAIAEVSIDLNDVVIDGTDNNTEPDAFNQDSAEQFDTKQENTEQPSNDVSAHAEPEPVLTSQPPATTTMSATASAPIDHYLQMVGLSHDEINPDTGIPDIAGLPTMHELNTADPQADMLDTVEVDAFENPLDDEHKEHPQHADHDADSVIDAPTEQSDINQDNDDDMLHQALNDMHNQF